MIKFIGVNLEAIKSCFLFLAAGINVLGKKVGILVLSVTTCNYMYASGLKQ